MKPGKEETQDNTENENPNRLDEILQPLPQEAQLVARMILDMLLLLEKTLKVGYKIARGNHQDEQKSDVASVMELVENNIKKFVKEHPNPSKAEIDQLMEASFKDFPKHLQPIAKMVQENVMNRLETEKKEKAVKNQEQNQLQENPKIEEKENRAQDIASNNKVDTVEEQKNPKKEAKLKAKSIKFAQRKDPKNDLKNNIEKSIENKKEVNGNNNPIKIAKRNRSKSDIGIKKESDLKVNLEKGAKRNRSLSNPEVKKEKEKKSRKYQPEMKEAFLQPLNQHKAYIRDNAKKKNARANANKVGKNNGKNRSKSVSL